ncbi:zinc ribbon domain-containing protein YjdM [Aestuariirhabdus litorea]|uniref:Alkylphosphonate utilization protein n=1 Tax=Aestuariirhabdus litorea TaxID=2528527 RepID=A0A3P3VQW5_9GAMM|nr:zinc ribbon domain-containing protein YjdM [Aestuariirhabdus litorea]RRJ84358.1 alkylphosphonate utilization protein [Aestuariirhabdus litorea]RWW97581.1 alkylphosphonate utilization protein [Endozoicomonadaceae bacterium GTF-13]
MADFPACPSCQAEYTYEDRGLFVCPSCGHEWSTDAAAEVEEEGLVVRDANGNPLADGDNVTLIKDLKVKGSSSVIKVGTKVRINRLVEGDHDIDCKVDGIGAMMLKSEFVKKA